VSTFHLNIDTDNAAFAGPFEGDEDPGPELVRILRKIATGIETDAEWCRGWDGWYQTILDANGNDVGRFALKRKGAE
jgi:hypothetical protein